MVLKRVGILSAGKLIGALYATLGLIGGAIIAFFLLVGVALPHIEIEVGAFPMLLLSLAAIIVIPIWYGAMGFIIGIIGAAIYNLIAGVVGGIELDFEPKPPQKF